MNFFRDHDHKFNHNILMCLCQKPESIKKKKKKTYIINIYKYITPRFFVSITKVSLTFLASSTALRTAAPPEALCFLDGAKLKRLRLDHSIDHLIKKEPDDDTTYTSGIVFFLPDLIV